MLDFRYVTCVYSIGVSIKNEMSLLNWSRKMAHLKWAVILVSPTKALKLDEFDGPVVSGLSRTPEITGPLLVNFIFPVLI